MTFGRSEGIGIRRGRRRRPTSDVAIIDEPAPSNPGWIGFENSSNNIGNVGTLRITTPSDDPFHTYTRLVGGAPDGTGAFSSTLNFGNSGRIELNRGTLGSINSFVIGSKGLLTLTNPGSITMSVAGGQELQVESRILGAGSLLIERHTASDSARILLADSGTFSTFTGGVRVNGGTLNTASLLIFGDSNPTDGGVLGKGTLWMDGGTVGVEEFQTYSVANPFVLERDAFAFAGGELSFNGTMTFASNQLTKQGTGTLVMNHSLFADAGTLALSDGIVRFHYNSAGSWVGNGTSTFGAVGVGTSGTLAGTVVKTGTAEFGASRFRTNTLSVQGGTLKVLDNGHIDGVSHVNSLSIGSSGKLDLRDNDIVINYSGDSPIGTYSTGTTVFTSDSIARYVQLGFGTGAWSGSTGIVTSVPGTGSLASAIGYAEASDIGSPSTWQGISLDGSAVLVRYTFFGDSDINGTTDIADFGILASNFNTQQLWYGGDYNYDSMADINDFSLQAASFNQTGRRGGSGLPPLAELYLAMLNFPNVYHEARLRPDIWWRFEEFELMGLGTIPPVPPYLVARGVPEPGSIAVLAFAAVASRRRRIAVQPA